MIPEENSRQHTVLVVDDNRAMGQLLQRNLEDKDTRVVKAVTGLEGITILNKARVDLVLLDIRLPDFSGWGILSLLRLTESLRHIPVIVVTGEPPNAALVAQFKPDYYMQKPFDIRDLLVRVKRAMNLGSNGKE